MSKDTEMFIAEVDAIFDSSQRSHVASQVKKASEYFGRPALLEEVAGYIAGRIQGRPGSRKEEDDVLVTSNGIEDYTDNQRRPQDVFVYGTNPQIHVGIGIDRKVKDIRYLNQASLPSGEVQQTVVTFFGLDRSEVVAEYYTPKPSTSDLPPVGVFVDFRRFTEGLEEISARVFGLIRPNVGRERSILACTPSNRTIFPFIGRHLSPDQSFGLVVDNSFLVPVQQTLKPNFFSKKLFEANQNMVKRRN